MEPPTIFYLLTYPQNWTPEELRRDTLQAMKERGITLPEMARRLKGKVPPRTLYNFLSEGRRPKHSTTAAIYQVLEGSSPKYQ